MVLKSAEKKKQLFITFTELYSKKQEWLEEQLNNGFEVFLMPQKGAPIKLTLAEMN